jgi:hypothetical protein
MSTEETEIIRGELRKLGGWVKTLVIISFSVGMWVATIELRQHQSAKQHEATADRIREIRHTADADRSILIEMRNDIRWIRESHADLKRDLTRQP